MRSDPKGTNLSNALASYVRELDGPSGRGITSAVPYVSADQWCDDFFEPLDVAGYNYSPDKYVDDHARLPDRVMVGTESYPRESFHVWESVWNNSWVIGDFVWTAMDYIGETAIGFESQTNHPDQCTHQEPYPFHVSFPGDLDLIGNQKPQGVYRQVLWNVTQFAMAVHRPMAPGVGEAVTAWGWWEERPSWTWTVGPGSTLSARVFAKDCCDSVALSINGKPVGTAQVNRGSQYIASFGNLQYAPGSITAVGMKAGKAVDGASVTFTTAGPPASLAVTADRSTIGHDRGALSHLAVGVFDAAGVPIPDSALEFRVRLAGSAAEIAAVGTGDPRDVSSVKALTKRMWRGKALVIVRPVGASPGTVNVTVSAAGLPSVTVKVTTQLTDDR